MQQTRFLEQSALKSLLPSSVSWAQLERGRLDVRYRLVDEAPLRVSSRTVNLAVRFTAEIEPNRVLLATIASPRSHAHLFGAPCESGAIAVCRGEIDIRTGGFITIDGVAIDVGAFQSHFPNAPDASELAEKLTRNGIMRNPSAATRLRSAVRSVCTGRVPAPLASGTVVPLLAEALDDFDDHYVERTQCLNRRFAAVRVCEAYMREHIDSPLTLGALSQVTRMRSRSLINAFEAITGYSPMDYLKRLRLSGVYTTLRRADRSETRIIDVAMDWGFWHMGHFTKDYRAMFGHTPSETLLEN
jgi:AraC-like DNA-binding protein